MPEDSALHRVQTSNREWTYQHAIQWQILRHLSFHTSAWRAWLKIKGKDNQDWPEFPWSEKDGTKTYGKVNEGDEDAAVAYLLSLSPQPGSE